jgi:excisionase family DNA binding protein
MVYTLSRQTMELGSAWFETNSVGRVDSTQIVEKPYVSFHAIAQPTMVASIALMVNIAYIVNMASKVVMSVEEKDQRDIQDLYSKLRSVEPKLVGPDGKTQVLPGSLYSFLCRLLADLKDGKSVTILQSEATLTTMEAAKILGVSRQFLIQEIEKGKISYHMVGTHRRLYARDVFAFKSNRDASRRKQLDDLALEEYKDGLYTRGLGDPGCRQ